MDDFAAKENKGLKEKNLYILHLDTPRLIIIGSVMIGLIVISLLVGMNINRQKSHEIVSQEDAMLNSLIADKPENVLPSSSSPVIPEDIENSIISQSEMPGVQNHAESSVTEPALLSNTFNHKQESKPASISPDILTRENIESIIPPSQEYKNIAPVKHEKKELPKKKSVKPEKKKDKKIIEVSSQKDSLKDKITQNNYFSVQVASFDKKSKAIAEKNALEKMKYNAFLDSTDVNGKTFYRVRIGPVYTRKQACKLLDEITENERYQESYLVENK